MALGKQQTEYWLSFIRHQAYQKIDNEALQQGIQICAERCASGTIPIDLISELKQFKSLDNTSADKMTILVAPICYERTTNNTVEYLTPYTVLATIDTFGRIDGYLPMPLPWFNWYWQVQESDLNEFPVQNKQAVDQYILLNPIQWNETQGSCAWSDQLNYANELFIELKNLNWELQLKKLGFRVSEQAILLDGSKLLGMQGKTLQSSLKNIQNQQTINPLIKPFFTDEVQTQARGELSSNFDYARSNDAVLLNDAQIRCLNKVLTLNTHQSLVITACPASGRESLIREAVINLQVNHLINDLEMPKIGLVVSPCKLMEAEILNQISSSGRWVEKYCLNEEEKATAISRFLTLCSEHLQTQCNDLLTAKMALKNKINECSKIIYEGIHAFKNQKKLEKDINQQFKMNGGLFSKIEEVEKNIETHLSHQRHIEVLISLWQRQFGFSTKLNWLMQWVPLHKKSKTKKITKLFKTYLPDEKIEGLGFEQMERRLYGLLNRAKQKSRSLQDSLNLLKSDAHQLELAKSKYNQWLSTYANKHIEDELELNKFLSATYRYQMYLFSIHYFEALVLLNEHSIQKENISLEEFAQQKWDYVFLQNAEQLSVPEGCALLTNARRFIAIGHHLNDAILPIPASHDQFLAQQFDLLTTSYTTDTNVETTPLLTATNFYKRATKCATFCAETWQLRKRYGWPKVVLDCYNALEKQYSLEAVNQSKKMLKLIQLPFTEGLDNSLEEQYQNEQELTEIIEWVEVLPEKEKKRILIVTPFHSQKLLILSKLSELKLDCHVMCHTEDVINQPYDIVIYSPVLFAKNKKGNTYHDEATLWLTILSSMSETLVLAGDPKLFKPELHSASGIVAKYLGLNSPVQAVQLNALEATLE